MKKRSKYKPKGVRLDAVSWVITGLRPMRDAKGEHQVLVTKNHSAIVEITQGRGTRAHADILISALNMAEAMCFVRAELGQDWAAELRAASDAVLAMCRRAVTKSGHFGFTGPELTAVNLAMEVHDAQLDTCTVGELEKAAERVRRVVATGNARKVAA